MYCLEEDVLNKIKEDVKFDSVYDEEARNYPLTFTTSAQSEAPVDPPGQDKRAQLLRRKMAGTTVQQNDTFEGRLDTEINSYVDLE